MRNASPLRYPGGKWRFSSHFENLLALNYKSAPIYIEPYAGGASLALSLLFSGAVREVHLNDIDVAIHAFWLSVLKNNAQFCQMVETTPITPTEWRRQRDVYRRGTKAGRLALGFATFFLNRTNHSGILNGGMIGGRQQKGEWTLDVRFNRAELVRRIRKLAQYKGKIHLHCKDAVKFLNTRRFGRRCFAYLDPPYYVAGTHLYFNAYKSHDHKLVRDCIVRLNCPWVVSYDDVKEIRDLYRRQRFRRLKLLHTARDARVGKEIMFFSQGLRIPLSVR